MAVDWARCDHHWNVPCGSLCCPREKNIIFFGIECVYFKYTVIIVVYLFYTICWFISQLIHFDSPIIFILLKSSDITQKYYHKSTLKNDFLEQVNFRIWMKSVCYLFCFFFASLCCFHVDFISWNEIIIVHSTQLLPDSI